MENQFDTGNELEIDLKDLLLELLSYWKWILLSMIFVAAIAFSISKFILVPKYESTAKLFVLTKSTSITTLADIQMGTSLTNDYMVTVKGRPVLDQVIANLDLNESYDSLKEKVTLNNPSNSRILEITVQDEDPKRAKVIADEIAEVGSGFIAEKMDQDPPTVIQRGYSDGKPVSPQTVKNTLIGAMIGALLACAIIVISYLFNDTIMVAEDIEKKLGLNVLGTLPLEEAEDDGEEKPTSKMQARKRKKNTNKTSN